MSNLRSFLFTFESDPRRPELEQDQIAALAEGFVRANEMALEHEPWKYPRSIEAAGLKYIEAPSCKGPHPCQPVSGAAPLVASRRETCFGLACLHAAMLRVYDGDKGAVVVIVPREGRYGPVPGRWHAKVRTGRGQILDTQMIVEHQAQYAGA